MKKLLYLVIFLFSFFVCSSFLNTNPIYADDEPDLIIYTSDDLPNEFFEGNFIGQYTNYVSEHFDVTYNQSNKTYTLTAKSKFILLNAKNHDCIYTKDGTSLKIIPFNGTSEEDPSKIEIHISIDPNSLSSDDSLAGINCGGSLQLGSSSGYLKYTFYDYFTSTDRPNSQYPFLLLDAINVKKSINFSRTEIYSYNYGNLLKQTSHYELSNYIGNCKITHHVYDSSLINNDLVLYSLDFDSENTEIYYSSISQCPNTYNLTHNTLFSGIHNTGALDINSSDLNFTGHDSNINGTKAISSDYSGTEYSPIIFKYCNLSIDKYDYGLYAMCDNSNICFDTFVNTVKTVIKTYGPCISTKNYLKFNIALNAQIDISCIDLYRITENNNSSHKTEPMIYIETATSSDDKIIYNNADNNTLESSLYCLIDDVWIKYNGYSNAYQFDRMIYSYIPDKNNSTLYICYSLIEDNVYPCSYYINDYIFDYKKEGVTVTFNRNDYIKKYSISVDGSVNKFGAIDGDVIHSAQGYDIDLHVEGTFNIERLITNSDTVMNASLYSGGELNIEGSNSNSKILFVETIKNDIKNNYKPIDIPFIYSRNNLNLKDVSITFEGNGTGVKCLNNLIINNCEINHTLIPYQVTNARYIFNTVNSSTIQDSIVKGNIASDYSTSIIDYGGIYSGDSVFINDTGQENCLESKFEFVGNLNAQHTDITSAPAIFSKRDVQIIESSLDISNCNFGIVNIASNLLGSEQFLIHNSSVNIEVSKVGILTNIKFNTIISDPDVTNFNIIKTDNNQYNYNNTDLGVVTSLINEYNFDSNYGNIMHYFQGLNISTKVFELINPNNCSLYKEIVFEAFEFDLDRALFYICDNNKVAKLYNKQTQTTTEGYVINEDIENLDVSINGDDVTITLTGDVNLESLNKKCIFANYGSLTIKGQGTLTINLNSSDPNFALMNIYGIYAKAIDISNNDTSNFKIVINDNYTMPEDGTYLVSGIYSSNAIKVKNTTIESDISKNLFETTSSSSAVAIELDNSKITHKPKENKVVTSQTFRNVTGSVNIINGSIVDIHAPENIDPQNTKFEVAIAEYGNKFILKDSKLSYSGNPYFNVSNPAAKITAAIFSTTGSFLIDNSDLSIKDTYIGILCLPGGSEIKKSKINIESKYTCIAAIGSLSITFDDITTHPFNLKELSDTVPIYDNRFPLCCMLSQSLTINYPQDKQYSMKACEQNNRTTFSDLDSQTSSLIEYREIKLVDNSEPAPSEPDYLCFTAQQDNSSVKLAKEGEPTSLNLQYKVNDGFWSTYTIDNSISLNNGDKLYFRNQSSAPVNFSLSTNDYYQFVMEGKVAGSGDVTTLLCYLGTDTLSEYCFSKLFCNCSSLTVAPTLPATNLADYCYISMFDLCTSLTTTPNLPATTLKKNCYYKMFCSCSGLASISSLPATNLNEYCYCYMFLDCTSLTDLSGLVLPASTLSKDCYSHMFDGCVNLVNAPALNATVLAENCYSYMFKHCTSIISAPDLPAINLAKRCYDHMFYQCFNLTFTPSLQASTLTEGCYSYMFYECSNLVNAPVLNSMNLANRCYEYMFFYCTKLENAPALPATILKPYCYSNMFNNCSKLANPPELPAETLAERCYEYMFVNCSSLVTTPSLPANNLTDYCYYNMFSNCSSLKTPPALPATNLADHCYTCMFMSCTSLKCIPSLPATTLVSSCYASMFLGCTNLFFSVTQDANYSIPYRMPSNENTYFDSIPDNDPFASMFGATGGSIKNKELKNYISNNSITIYFKPYPVSLTYDGNGNDVGDAPIDSGDRFYNQSFSLADGSSLKKGELVFSSWNTKADGTGTTYNVGDTIILLLDTTLYAIYEEQTGEPTDYDFRIVTSNYAIYFKDETQIYPDLETNPYQNISYFPFEILPNRDTKTYKLTYSLNNVTLTNRNANEPIIETKNGYNLEITNQAQDGLEAGSLIIQYKDNLLTNEAHDYYAISCDGDLSISSFLANSTRNLIIIFSDISTFDSRTAEDIVANQINFIYSKGKVTLDNISVNSTNYGGLIKSNSDISVYGSAINHSVLPIDDSDDNIIEISVIDTLNGDVTFTKTNDEINSVLNTGIEENSHSSYNVSSIQDSNIIYKSIKSKNLYIEYGTEFIDLSGNKYIHNNNNICLDVSDNISITSDSTLKCFDHYIAIKTNNFEFINSRCDISAVDCCAYINKIDLSLSNDYLFDNGSFIMNIDQDHTSDNGIIHLANIEDFSNNSKFKISISPLYCLKGYDGGSNMNKYENFDANNRMSYKTTMILPYNYLGPNQPPYDYRTSGFYICDENEPKLTYDYDDINHKLVLNSIYDGSDIDEFIDWDIDEDNKKITVTFKGDVTLESSGSSVIQAVNSTYDLVIKPYDENSSLTLEYDCDESHIDDILYYGYNISGIASNKNIYITNSTSSFEGGLVKIHTKDLSAFDEFRYNDGDLCPGYGIKANENLYIEYADLTVELLGDGIYANEYIEIKNSNYTFKEYNVVTGPEYISDTNNLLYGTSINASGLKIYAEDNVSTAEREKNVFDIGIYNSDGSPLDDSNEYNIDLYGIQANGEVLIEDTNISFTGNKDFENCIGISNLGQGKETKIKDSKIIIKDIYAGLLAFGNLDIDDTYIDIVSEYCSIGAMGAINLTYSNSTYNPEVDHFYIAQTKNSIASYTPYNTDLTVQLNCFLSLIPQNEELTQFIPGFNINIADTNYTTFVSNQTPGSDGEEFNEVDYSSFTSMQDIPTILGHRQVKIDHVYVPEPEDGEYDFKMVDNNSNSKLYYFNGVMTYKSGNKFNNLINNISYEDDTYTLTINENLEITSKNEPCIRTNKGLKINGSSKLTLNLDAIVPNTTFDSPTSINAIESSGNLTIGNSNENLELVINDKFSEYDSSNYYIFNALHSNASTNIYKTLITSNIFGSVLTSLNNINIENSTINHNVINKNNLDYSNSDIINHYVLRTIKSRNGRLDIKNSNIKSSIPDIDDDSKNILIGLDAKDGIKVEVSTLDFESNPNYHHYNSLFIHNINNKIEFINSVIKAKNFINGISCENSEIEFNNCEVDINVLSNAISLTDNLTIKITDPLLIDKFKLNSLYPESLDQDLINPIILNYNISVDPVTEETIFNPVIINTQLPNGYKDYTLAFSSDDNAYEKQKTDVASNFYKFVKFINPDLIINASETNKLKYYNGGLVSGDALNNLQVDYDEYGYYILASDDVELNVPSSEDYGIKVLGDNNLYFCDFDTHQSKLTINITNEDNDKSYYGILAEKLVRSSDSNVEINFLNIYSEGEKTYGIKANTFDLNSPNPSNYTSKISITNSYYGIYTSESSDINYAISLNNSNVLINSYGPCFEIKNPEKNLYIKEDGYSEGTNLEFNLHSVTNPVISISDVSKISISPYTPRQVFASTGNGYFVQYSKDNNNDYKAIKFQSIDDYNLKIVEDENNTLYYTDDGIFGSSIEGLNIIEHNDDAKYFEIQLSNNVMLNGFNSHIIESKNDYGIKFTGSGALSLNIDADDFGTFYGIKSSGSIDIIGQDANNKIKITLNDIYHESITSYSDNPHVFAVLAYTDSSETINIKYADIETCSLGNVFDCSNADISAEYSTFNQELFGYEINDHTNIYGFYVKSLTFNNCEYKSYFKDIDFETRFENQCVRCENDFIINNSKLYFDCNDSDTYQSITCKKFDAVDSIIDIRNSRIAIASNENISFKDCQVRIDAIYSAFNVGDSLTIEYTDDSNVSFIINTVPSFYNSDDLSIIYYFNGFQSNKLILNLPEDYAFKGTEDPSYNYQDITEDNIGLIKYAAIMLDDEDVYHPSNYQVDLKIQGTQYFDGDDMLFTAYYSKGELLGQELEKLDVTYDEDNNKYIIKLHDGFEIKSVKNEDIISSFNDNSIEIIGSGNASFTLTGDEEYSYAAIIPAITSANDLIIKSNNDSSNNFKLKLIDSIDLENDGGERLYSSFLYAKNNINITNTDIESLDSFGQLLISRNKIDLNNSNINKTFIKPNACDYDVILAVNDVNINNSKLEFGLSSSLAFTENDSEYIVRGIITSNGNININSSKFTFNGNKYGVVANLAVSKPSSYAIYGEAVNINGSDINIKDVTCGICARNDDINVSKVSNAGVNTNSKLNIDVLSSALLAKGAIKFDYDLNSSHVANLSKTDSNSSSLFGFDNVGLIFSNTSVYDFANAQNDTIFVLGKSDTIREEKFKVDNAINYSNIKLGEYIPPHITKHDVNIPENPEVPGTMPYFEDDSLEPHRYYSDPEGEHEIEDLDEWKNDDGPDGGYIKPLAGDDSYTFDYSLNRIKGTQTLPTSTINKKLVNYDYKYTFVRDNDSFDEFVCVRLDGEIIDQFDEEGNKNFDVVRGSIEVTFTKDYLLSLDVKNGYVIDIIARNGHSTGTFNVIDTTNQENEDDFELEIPEEGSGEPGHMPYYRDPDTAPDYEYYTDPSFNPESKIDDIDEWLSEDGDGYIAPFTELNKLNYKLYDTANEVVELENIDKKLIKNNHTYIFLSNNANLDLFVCVRIDGVIVDPSKYTVFEGVRVSFTDDYLKSLSKNAHTFELITRNGKSKGTFKVVDTTPQSSGDSSHDYNIPKTGIR